MPVRDLGYRSYDGVRLSATHGGRVFFRHALRRAWASWLLKIAVFLGWIPAAVHVAIIVLQYALSRSMPTGVTEGLNPNTLVASILGWQLWIVVPLATAGIGASVIAEDLELRAFRFYLAKPLTPRQYVLGRVGAAAIWCAALVVIPAILVIAALAGTAPTGEWFTRLALLLPAAAGATLVSVVMACCAVGVSSLGRSRALTTSAWFAVLFVPHVIGWILFRATDNVWVQAASLGHLLDVALAALLSVTKEPSLSWIAALAILVAAAAASLAAAFRRTRSAEVVG